MKGTCQVSDELMTDDSETLNMYPPSVWGIGTNVGLWRAPRQCKFKETDSDT